MLQSASAALDPLATLARPNAATAVMDRVQAAFQARDWAAMRAACTPDAKFDDRRRIALVSGNADWWVAGMQRIVEAPNLRYERTLVGAFGERVDLERVLWTGGPPDGRFESEHLWLTEVDDSGRMVFAVAFDADDRRAAYREAWARQLANDPAAAVVVRPLVDLVEGFNERDPARIRAVVADDIVAYDRRRTGQGRTDGVEAVLQPVLWTLAPDIQLEVTSIIALESHGGVGVGRYFGTHLHGGAFESLFVCVAIVAHGRFTRHEYFEIEDLDAALARFAELRPDPLRIPPNAATRANDRWLACIEARDRDALRALCERIEYDDRRRSVRVTGDCDMAVADSRLIAGLGARASRTLLATSGQQLALERIVWATDDDSEIEVLNVIEVDAEGRIVALVSFDPDDRRAASIELLERYFRGEGARWTPAAQIELVRALNDHDLGRMRAALPDDFFFNDHRRTGIGRVGNADDYVASIGAVFEQSPDVTTNTLYHVAVDAHGSLSVGSMFGTLLHGGEFESVFVRLNVYQDGRVIGTELFEPEELDVAQAWFEALRPQPALIPPNAATRASQQIGRAFRARDWGALRSLARADFTFTDRRRRALVSGDVDLLVKNFEYVRSTWPDLRTTFNLIGTVGDRIALERLTFVANAKGGISEGEFLRVMEVDADGRLQAVIHFDDEDRADAFAEAHARFAAGEAAGAGQSVFAALSRASARWDLEAVRTCLADDAVLHDRRAVGVLGENNRDQWLDSLRTLMDLAPDSRSEQFRVLAWNGHGRVAATRRFGTMRNGGAFETVFVGVWLTAGDRIRHYEIFDIDDANRALARFDELCAERTG